MKIKIDRSTPFDPVIFLGKGWTIEEEDEKSLALIEVDLNNVHLVESDDVYISGEEWLKRLKEAGHIRLDAKIFQTLWENQHLIPEKWKKRVGCSSVLILFEGTILRSSCGRRCVLYLFWRWDKWYRSFCWLDGSGCDDSLPSAVLVS